MILVRVVGATCEVCGPVSDSELNMELRPPSWWRDHIHCSKCLERGVLAQVRIAVEPVEVEQAAEQAAIADELEALNPLLAGSA